MNDQLKELVHTEEYQLKVKVQLNPQPTVEQSQ